MDTLECFFADFLQRSGFDRDALQVCCFFKRTLADGLNVFADHNFFQFLIALECFVCDRSYLEGVFAGDEAVDFIAFDGLRFFVFRLSGQESG